MFIINLSCELMLTRIDCEIINKVQDCDAWRLSGVVELERGGPVLNVVGLEPVRGRGPQVPAVQGGPTELYSGS